MKVRVGHRPEARRPPLSGVSCTYVIAGDVDRRYTPPVLLDVSLLERTCVGWGTFTRSTSPTYNPRSVHQ